MLQYNVSKLQKAEEEVKEVMTAFLSSLASSGKKWWQEGVKLKRKGD